MKKIKKYALGFWEVLKGAGSEFSNDNAMKLSASLSYYTIFSLAPLIVVVISLCGVFFGQEAIHGQIYGQIKGLVGGEAAVTIQQLIKNAQLTNKSVIASIVSGVTLILGATGIFIEIQDSINYIWAIKSKPKKGWLKYLTNRFLSFSLIVSIGFLLIVSLVVSAALDALSGKLEQLLPEAAVVAAYIFSMVFGLLVISVLFAIIFKVLPDGKVGWKEAMVGASFTAVMFMIGRTVISVYIAKTDVASTYGSASSVIIILLWVYYSSIILYFGAEFTKVYAEKFGKKIIPNDYAVLIQKSEIHVDPVTGKEDQVQGEPKPAGPGQKIPGKEEPLLSVK